MIIPNIIQKGKNQQFNLGKFFRRRYNSLLGEQYSPNKIYIQSTDTDRTLMSAQANLAGMFPPTTEQEKWHESIAWQPIPVHTIPHRMDHILSGGKECLKYNIALKEYMDNSKEVQRIYTEYSEYFPYWSKMTGNNITTIFQVLHHYDTLKVEMECKKKFVERVCDSLKSFF